MSGYADRGRRPTSLTELEQLQILRATGAEARSYRDHCLISMAMGTGLREHELVALDVVDVVGEGGKVRRRIRLRTFKGAARLPPRRRVQWVVLPDECRRKLERWVRELGDGPLFPSREGGGRLSTRQVRTLWRRWQERAEFERLHPFHALRHTFVSNVYEATRDPFVAQALARHARVETTQAYAHVGDEQLERAVRKLRC